MAPAASPAPSVLIVDDHAEFRASARRLLELAGLSIVAEAPDGASAVDLAARLEPDIVLLDIALPDTDGFEVAEQISATSDSAVVLTSSRTRSDFPSRLRKSSARGFISKAELSGEAILAIVERGR